MMIIAILAGGRAVRLGTLAKDKPKCMLPVCGEPFIGHQLRLLASSGIEKVHLCLGHLSGPVLEYVGDGRRFGLKVSFSVEENQLLGTAGALAVAREYLGDCFGVLYGDAFLPLPYAEIAKVFDQCGTAGMMTVWNNQNVLGRSNVTVEKGLVTAYSREDNDPVPYEWIDYGLSFFRSEALEKLGIPDAPIPLAEVWSDLSSRGELSAYIVNQRFYEIGSIDGYRELSELAESEGLPHAPLN